MSQSVVRLHLIISGLVQGVGFRTFVVRHGARLGLTGWVRNTEDGDVEVTAEGPRASLDQFLAACRRGPSSARITYVEEDRSEATGEFRGFRITW